MWSERMDCACLCDARVGSVDRFCVTPFQIAIADGWAIEVGSVEATYRLSAKNNPVSVNDKGMRLLKRQSDGSWKFALVGLK